MTSDIIIYTTDDGKASIELHLDNGTVWLTQLELAELFQTSKQNISKHTKAIFEDGELTEEATVNYQLTVQNEGVRQVQRKVAYYNLDMILAVGYRVRSPRGVQFRTYASTVLKEYLIKGFAMDDDRLKNLGGKIKRQQMLDKVTTEYRKYQAKTLTQVEKDYLAEIRTIENLAKEGGKTDD